MSENDLKLNPEAPSSDKGLSIATYPGSVLRLETLLNLAVSDSSIIELPQAIPTTQKLDAGNYVLVGLRFETAAEAAHFANRLARVVTQIDRGGGRYLFFERTLAIIRDEHGNCFGLN